MKASVSNAIIAALVCTFALLQMTVHAAPMEAEDEPMDNALMAHPDNTGDMSGQWDAIDTDALRKLLMQLDEDRLVRAARSWPQAEPRAWGLRNGRITKQWRADKRQVRFRQCYFNPISCFRK